MGPEGGARAAPRLRQGLQCCWGCQQHGGKSGSVLKPLGGCAAVADFGLQGPCHPSGRQLPPTSSAPLPNFCRRYQPNPQTFGLSALECASVLENADKHQPMSFVHDPYKGGEGEGRIIKTLRWACHAILHDGQSRDGLARAVVCSSRAVPLVWSRRAAVSAGGQGQLRLSIDVLNEASSRICPAVCLTNAPRTLLTAATLAHRSALLFCALSGCPPPRSRAGASTWP